MDVNFQLQVQSDLLTGNECPIYTWGWRGY